jgi:pimeloyl-ACP methyl ester carboxylesterase
MLRISLACAALLFAAIARADGPQDNIADKVRPVPPPGIKLSDADRQELTDRTAALGKEIAALPAALKGKPALLELIPDVQIYYNAVHYALKYNEFFKPAEVKVAGKLLQQGFERAKLLRAGKAPWVTDTGLVVRGYVSKIDGSVQPYGLVIPKNYKPGSGARHRLDVWFHGRGETLSELNFINGRQNSPGDFTPAGAFVLHPYGRYCNANHFAGEIDTIEAITHLHRYYPIDDNRIAVRGFSMGGAACWNFAVHYSDRWAAAAPGAGFSETPEFLRVFQKEKFEPTWWEKKLLHWYDCTDWALNLSMCPTVAYSGEIDSQKQAADIMAKAMAAEGLNLVHIIGPKTGHSYHPAAKVEINRRMDSIVGKGRDALPRNVDFVTYTLRYPRMSWVTVEGMGKHWEEASVKARLGAVPNKIPGDVLLQANNVTALTLSFAPGYCPFEPTRPVVLGYLRGEGDKVRPETVELPRPGSDRSFVAHLVRSGDEWKVVKSLNDGKLRKRPGLQGPIDDAFMDKFVMVRPTGQPLNDAVGKWAAGEMAHAVKHWRIQFRGELKPKDDTQVTDADIASSNLVLWGDPSSNKVLAKIADKLPIKWDANGVHLNGKTLEAGKHVPVLIYPNPLNPKKYVVLNSGFTFREYDYLNNARQVPKLPDWAILDVTQPPTPRRPAGIVDAGFFDEQWRLSDRK